MNRRMPFFLAAALLLASPVLKADIDENDLGSEPIYRSEDEDEDDRNLPGPLKVEVTGDFIGKSKFDKHRLRHKHISFWEGEIETGLIYYYNSHCKEGANVDLSYTLSKIGWHDNPFFDKELFKTITLSFGGFTKRVCRWLWRGQVSINVDADHIDFSEYAYYDFLLWGRYEWCRDIGLNIGFIGQTGMKVDRVYPILGIDWQVCKKWKLNLVFPVNISAVYEFADHWSVAVAARVFDSLHRVSKYANVPKAVIEYRNSGGEIALNYDLDHKVKANIHAGTTFGGQLKLANRHYKHHRRFNFDAAPYIGGEAVVRF